MTVLAPERHNPTTIVDIDHLLTEKVAFIESEAVRGLPIEADRSHAFGLLHHYGQLQNWSEQRQQEENYQLADRLDTEPQPSAFHRWLNVYANRARDAKENGDSEARGKALGDGLDCLNQLALVQEWGNQKSDKERKRFEDFANGLNPDKNSETHSTTLLAAIGLVGLSGFGKLSSVMERRDKKSNSDENPHRKRNIAIVAGGIVLAGAGAVLVAKGYDFGLGGIGSSHHHVDALKHTMKPKTSPNQTTPMPSVQQSSPAIHHSPTPKASRAPSLTHHHAPVIHRATASPQQQLARQPIESLSRPGDTIWAHAREKLGNRATNSRVQLYVNKILKTNHLTYAKARFLRVGTRFRLPQV